MPKMPDGNSSAESYHARNVPSETPNSTPMEIITDYTKLPDLIDDQENSTWLEGLALCFGPHLQSAIYGLDVLAEARPDLHESAASIRRILRELSDIEKSALNRAEDWDENL